MTPDSKKRCEVELYRLKKEKEKKERKSKNAKPAGKNDVFVDAQRYLHIYSFIISNRLIMTDFDFG